MGGFILLRPGLELGTLLLPAGFLLDSTYRIHIEKAEEGTCFLFSLSLPALPRNSH